MYRHCKIYIFAQIILCLLLVTDVYGQSLPPNVTLHLMADSVVIGSGQNVAQWKDLSANNYQVLQSSSSNQPAFTQSVTILNNKPVISFDGTNDFFFINAPVTLGTVFIVSRWVGPEAFFPENNGLISCSVPPYSWLNGRQNMTLLRDEQFLITVDRNGINSPSRDYGVLQDFNILSTYKAPTTYPHIYIGNSEGVISRSWKGDIAEIIAYNTALTTAEIKQVEQYLNNKYAPQITLPSDILITNSLCDTTITPHGTFTNYNWSTGATTSTISVNKSGKYWVDATNIFGQISSDTILVNYPGNLLTQNEKICENSILNWNTNLSKDLYTFQWQDNSTDSLFIISQAGNYFVNITDINGCSINSNTISITVDALQSSISLGSDVSICSGKPIFLTSGASAVSSYTWNDGSNNDSLIITTAGQYSVIVTNTTGCTAMDTIIISIQGLPPTADFVSGIACYNSVVSFTNLSTVPAGNTLSINHWNFGDSTSPNNVTSLANPSHTFSDTGIYIVKLTITSNVGCDNTVSKIIQVAPTPSVNFSNNVVCRKDTIYFINTTLNAPGYMTSNINWNFNDPNSGVSNTSSLNTPSHLFSNNSVYSPTLTITNNAGCSSAFTKTIQPISGNTSTIPTSISGLNLWITADCVHKSPTTSAVDTCYDLSGNFKHAIQTNINERGTLIPNAIGGHSVIRFDGTNDSYLINSSLTLGTVFLVSRWVGPETVFPENNGLISCSVPPYSWINGKQDSTRLRDQQLMLNVHRNGVYSPYRDYGNLQDFNILSTFKTPTSYPHIIIGNSEGAISRSWKGDIAEILAYDTVLSNTQIKQIEKYLSDKYAPPVTLPEDISITNSSFCDTILIPVGAFKSYRWSTGEATRTISVNKSEKYWVNATNMFDIVSSDTILVNFPDYHLPSETSICLNNQLIWDTELPKSKFIFQWQDNSTDSLFTINQAGNYYLKITDLFGCNITSDTVKITVDNFSTTTSLGNDTTLCAGNSITLTSGYSPSHSYLWSTGSTNDSLLVSIGGQYSVVVTNTNNCTAKDTINVTIQGQAPIANFTTSIGCINSIVYFTDLSLPPLLNTISAYEWNFGDIGSATNTSTLSNPSHTYTNTGTYTVSLKVISSAGCEQLIRKTIQVFPKPTVNFTSGLSCQNDSTTFSSLCTSVSGYSISSLNWNFGDPTSTSNTSNLVFPKHLFSNQTNYTIKLVATNNVGCKDSLINIIAVKAQVKADFIISSPCANNATFFQDNSIVPPAPTSNIRTWNFGNGPINSLNASKTYTSSGVYSVSLTVNSSNQCSSTISKLVTIFSRPTASFSIPGFCAKDTITVTNLSVAQSGIISLFNWKLNNSNFSSIQSPSLSVSNAGNYTVRLTVTNSFGCKDSTTNSVTVNPLPNIDFVTNPSTYYYINSPIIFIPSITNASSYLWNLTSIGTSTIQSPTVTYNNEGTYTVSLNVKDQQGCQNLVTKTLLVSKRFLDVAILNVNSLKDNDGFMTVQTDIANYGSIPISTLELSCQISDGGNIKETWYGTLNPNSFFSYTFVSKTATQIGSSNNMTCIDIKKTNGINDENQSNNELCNVLNSDEITVSNPIPNPTNAEITLPIILNKEIDIFISIYNSTGQIQYQEKTQRGVVGLNLITLPTANYQRGCYIIKTVIDDEVFIKKFIKISNE